MAGRGVRILAGVVGALFLFPLGYLVVRTTSLGADFGELLLSSATAQPLVNSLAIATSTAVTAGVLGSALAFLVVRTQLPGRRLLRWALALPLVVPSYVGATAVLAAFGPGALIGSIPRLQGFWGSLVVLTLLTYPYVYLPVVGRLSTTAPELEEAARLLGDTPGRAVRKVVVPQIRGAAGAGMLLVFLYGAKIAEAV